jgi:hypothetical protein
MSHKKEIAVPAGKTALYNYIERLYEHPSETIEKERFFKQTWEALYHLIQHNRYHPLVIAVVKEYPYFIVWSYTLLTILHGSYGHAPRLTTVLKDAVDLLGEDLIEKELRFCEYVRKVQSPFFPGLFDTWLDIQRIHQDEYFNTIVLPPTAYHSYVLYTLNNTAAIGKRTSPEAIYGTLSVMHAKMTKVISVAHKPTT